MCVGTVCILTRIGKQVEVVYMILVSDQFHYGSSLASGRGVSLSSSPSGLTEYVQASVCSNSIVGRVSVVSPKRFRFFLNQIATTRAIWSLLFIKSP